MPALTGGEAASAGRQEIDPLVLRPIRAEEELIRLRGPPDAVVGVVALARGPEPAQFSRTSPNRDATKVGYRLRLGAAELLSSSLPAAPGGETRLRFGIELPPETKARVPVRFSVARTTPPGVYEALFDVGGEPRRAEIEILPKERLDIGPRGLVLKGAPGEAAQTELLFSNRGNVPLTLDVLGGLILEDLEPLCLSVQRALSQVRARECQDDAHRLFLDALVKNVADKRADLGRVRVAGGPATIEPGDSAMLGVEFHFPDNMTPGRRYRATLQYGTGRVSLRVEAVPRTREPDAKCLERPRRTGKKEAR